MKIVAISEQSLLITFEQTIKPDVFQQVLWLSAEIEASPWGKVITDVVPAYASIYIQLNTSYIQVNTSQPLALIIESIQQLYATLNQSSDQTHHSSSSHSSRLHRIPVYYGDEVALDIDAVSEQTGLSHQEIIQRHSATVYDVYAVGFAPGFAYLGILDDALVMPRKATPRLCVPKGSVAIAEKQTSMYPTQTPGGWQIIGNSPLFLSLSDEDLLSLFTVGDQVMFTPIARDEFLLLSSQCLVTNIQ